MCWYLNYILQYFLVKIPLKYPLQVTPLSLKNVFSFYVGIITLFLHKVYAVTWKIVQKFKQTSGVILKKNNNNRKPTQLRTKTIEKLLKTGPNFFLTILITVLIYTSQSASARRQKNWIFKYVTTFTRKLNTKILIYLSFNIKTEIKKTV